MQKYKRYYFGIFCSYLQWAAVLIAFGVNPSLGYDFPKQTPQDCLSFPDQIFAHYFDIATMSCQSCAQENTIQTVSADGLSCVCQPQYRLSEDFGGGRITCEACAADEVASASGWVCVACASPLVSGSTSCPVCQNNEIVLERNLTGSWSGSPTQTCGECDVDTTPNEQGQQCVRCNQVLSMIPAQDNCQCPANQEARGVCFQDPTEVISDQDATLFQVYYAEIILSAFFDNNIQSANALCLEKYNNYTACQVLGNMCVMITYTRDNEGNAAPPRDACTLYLNYESQRGIAPGKPDEWKVDIPWLYYAERSTTQILLDSSIPVQYTFPDSSLNIKAATYNYTGEFQGLNSVTGGLLQLCPATDLYLDSAWKFGTYYKQECNLKVRHLFDDIPMKFFDLYLEYTFNDQETLFPIPVLVLNYVVNDEQVNRQGEWRDSQDLWLEWQFTRRIFLVDNISAKSRGTIESPGVGPLQYVRYAKTIKLTVRLQDDTTSGRIYPPYLSIDYADASRAQYDSDASVPVTFEVEYIMETSGQQQSMSIAVGVLAGLVFLLSLLQSWIWSKRAGQIAIDCVTLIKFLLFLCGNLANVFFVVSFGYALWSWIFFKEQGSVRIFLPTRDQEQLVIVFLACGFVFKVIHVLHLLVAQVTVDVFFLDWERPRNKGGKSGDEDELDGSVSVWRTYFVANEWNEIQTLRKINFHAQLFLTLFFLVVLGFENLGTSDPVSDFTLADGDYHAPSSRLLRYAIGALAYLLVAVGQWIFITFIYERFFDNPVQDFVDFCSLNNVSVFIMENARFGYYIHGRSVHGQADVGLREMFKNMKREEDDMCGKRGLVEETEQQTFQIALPQRLREKYDQVMRPLLVPEEAGGKGQAQERRRGGDVEKGGNLSAITENAVTAYRVINKFLQKFIEHSLKKVDYTVKDKNFFETVLNAEFEDTSQLGIFYNDNGHSFDQCVFYGHENTLTICELLLFCLVDLIAENFVLATFIVYMFDFFLMKLRDSLGRSNLAKKTLVDERLLI